MDSFETSYDEDTEPIQCTVCDKSIRGDSMYKIHVTTPGHLKPHNLHLSYDRVRQTWYERGCPYCCGKFLTFLPRALPSPPENLRDEWNRQRQDEPYYPTSASNLSNALVAELQKILGAGLAVRRHVVPVFEDIMQFLDYVKLDEPIIGLNFLDEVPNNDQHGSLRYTCRLCHHTSNLYEIVHHLIGRKHRQKYVELKRPDLVTWDKQSVVSQRGKTIRAKAEIVERQDGRGHPSMMPKKRTEDNFNSRGTYGSPWHNLNVSQTVTQRDLTSHLPKLMDFQFKNSNQERCPPDQPNGPPSCPEDPYSNQDWQKKKEREDAPSYDHFDAKLRRADYSESNVCRREYTDTDHHRDGGEEYVKGPPRTAIIDPGVTKYNSRVEMRHDQTPDEECYQEMPSPYNRPFPERDYLDERYSDDMKSGQSCSSEYQPSQQVHSEGNNRRWSLDRESGRHGSLNKTERQGSSEPEAKGRAFTTTVERDLSRGLLFNVHDYGHKSREPRQEEVTANPGPSRTGPALSQRQVEVTSCMSDIPEPFKRFLKGATQDEVHGKRKRKSRFSDATAEEVETTKEMFSDNYGPPNPKFGGCPRPVSSLLRSENNELQRSDLYAKPQGPHHSESFHRGGSESAGVFDMLQNIQIDNAEEAEFLKSRLCDLLKEFKAKKSEKTAQKAYHRAVIPKDYNSSKQDAELSTRPYERTLIDDSDFRQPAENNYFQGDLKRRDWKQHEHVPEGQLQEYNRPVHGESRRSNSNRNSYEGDFGSPEMSLTSRTTRPNELARYPERFKEPMHSRDYRPAGEFLDIHSSSSPLRMDRQSRLDRDIRYANNLDKITSTLLELVKRK